MRWIIAVLAVAMASYAQEASAASSVAASGGYVVGNFGLAAQVDEGDGPRAWIKVNPPKLGVWLRNFAEGQLWLEEDDHPGRRLSLRPVRVSRLYPEYRVTFAAPENLQVRVRVFAPLSRDADTNFLPGLIIQVELESRHKWSGTVGYTLRQAKAEPHSDDDSTPWPATIQPIAVSGVMGAVRGPAFLAVDDAHAASNDDAGKLSVAVPITIQPGSPHHLIYVAGAFDPHGHYIRQASTAEQLVSYLLQHAKGFEKDLQTFEAALPNVGDPRIGAYVRWYSSAAILLTKGLDSGEVLTMGYRELNPRDSFWTSGIHLVFWKALERKMIEEIAAGQRPSGRIPATVLPVFDRVDEIDTSEYFILRVARYYRWYRDEPFLAQQWPAVRKAVDYLTSRDTEGVGVPMQGSYWADWKDVPAVQGRTYAPHFALLWLASLRAAAEMAAAVNDSATVSRYAAMAARAAAFVNRPFKQGGLWNGHHYVDRWSDGRQTSYVLQDQTVGAYFDVLPRDRLALLYEQLQKSETPWGVRETFPFIADWTDESGGTPGNYHNGGIWPYLNFVDAAGRYMNGQGAQAERIIREVGAADIDARQDEKPNEYLNGETGANRGFSLQGWDAALFSTIYFGAFGLQRISGSQMHVHVRLPNKRDFRTVLVLPDGDIEIQSRAGQLSWRSQPSPTNSPKPAKHMIIKIFDERGTLTRDPQTSLARMLERTRVPTLER